MKDYEIIINAPQSVSIYRPDGAVLPKLHSHTGTAGLTLDCPELDNAEAYKVFRNGALQQGGADYSASGTTLTFAEELEADDIITLEAWHYNSEIKSTVELAAAASEAGTAIVSGSGIPMTFERYWALETLQHTGPYPETFASRILNHNTGKDIIEAVARIGDSQIPWDWEKNEDWMYGALRKILMPMRQTYPVFYKKANIIWAARDDEKGLHYWYVRYDTYCIYSFGGTHRMIQEGEEEYVTTPTEPNSYNWLLRELKYVEPTEELYALAGEAANRPEPIKPEPNIAILGLRLDYNPDKAEITKVYDPDHPNVEYYPGEYTAEYVPKPGWEERENDHPHTTNPDIDSHYKREVRHSYLENGGEYQARDFYGQDKINGVWQNDGSGGFTNSISNNTPGYLNIHNARLHVDYIATRDFVSRRVCHITPAGNPINAITAEEAAAWGVEYCYLLRDGYCRMTYPSFTTTPRLANADAEPTPQEDYRPLVIPEQI